MIVGQQLVCIASVALAWTSKGLAVENKNCEKLASPAAKCAEKANTDGGTAFVQKRSSVKKHRGEHKVRIGDSALLTSALGPSHVAFLEATVAHDGLSAKVRFTYAGKVWEYPMASFSVYAHDAKVRRYTIDGIKEHLPGPSSSFQSRHDGKWASATLRQDGSVIGLFQVQGSVVRVEPAAKDDPDVLSFLATASGKSNAHYFRQFDMARLFARQSLDRPRREPRVGDADDGSHIPRFNGSFETEVGLMTNTRAWGGTKWWPGCYKGDDKLNEFKVGVIGDVDLFWEHGDKTLPGIEGMFAEATFVYEHQLHVKLSIGSVVMYETEIGAPNYAIGCDEPEPSVERKFSQFMKAEIPFEGATHLFTGCGDGNGIVGVASVGTICSPRGMQKAVNQFHDTGNWLTFAHELGHNFNAEHSFENGEKTTGGIMDYGDGTLNGEYQFNTDFRKAEMCEEMDKWVGNCQGNFEEYVPPVPTPAPPPTPVPPSAAPTPYPPTPPWTVTGDCKRVGDCATSPNYPAPYDNEQSCTISKFIGKISVKEFEVEEGFDWIKIGSQKFSGDDVPDGVYPHTDIVWSSDYMQLDPMKGWKICSYQPTPEPTESPTFPTGPCKSFCETSTKPISTKCRFAKCTGCAFCPSNNYVLGNKGEDVCPIGSSVITVTSECKKAAGALGYKVAGAWNGECFLAGNKIKMRKKRGRTARLVCKKATQEPTLSPTPSPTFIPTPSPTLGTPDPNNADCEMRILEAVNFYRMGKNLPVIPISPSLCFVAKTHAEDSTAHPPPIGCNLHSWSEHGPWQHCCVNDNPSSGPCQWNKAKELTSYPGYSFENTVAHAFSPEGAVSSWTKSPAHNAVMLNEGPWSKPWLAMGAAMIGGWAHLHFGNEKDPLTVVDESS